MKLFVFILIPFTLVSSLRGMSEEEIFLTHYSSLSSESKRSLAEQEDLYQKRIVDIIDRFNLVGGGSALDAGSGTGALTKALSQNGFKVFSVEPDFHMLSAGYFYNNYQCAEKIFPFEIQGISQKFNNSFDYIISSSFFVPDEETGAFLDRVKDLLKDNGMFFLTLTWSLSGSETKMIELKNNLLQLLSERFYNVSSTESDMQDVVPGCSSRKIWKESFILWDKK